MDEELCPTTSSSFLGLPPVLASTTLGLGGGLSATRAAGELASLSPPGLAGSGPGLGVLSAGIAGCCSGFAAYDGLAAASQWQPDDVDDSLTCCLPPVLATTPPSVAFPMALPNMSWPPTPAGGVLATTPSSPVMEVTVKNPSSDNVSRHTVQEDCWSRDELLRIRGAMEAVDVLHAASEDGANLGRCAAVCWSGTSDVAPLA